MEARERALLWAEGSGIDSETREKTRSILNDDLLLQECFGSELQFGTGGLRGILGVGTGKMNRYTVARATLGFGRTLLQSCGSPSVAIAYDSRRESEAFASITAQVLCKLGIRIHLFPALAPTPLLSYCVRTLRCDGGVMITASHNPAQYNGYKVYGPDGCQITDQAAARITSEIQRTRYDEAELMSPEQAIAHGLWKWVGEEIHRGFAQACLFCRLRPELTQELQVVYTPLYGTGLQPVQEVLAVMQGVRLSLVAEQSRPDGNFPTCPKPNPELDEALALGLAQAKNEKADLLLATDPDCDRVGVVVKDQNGRYHRLSGNEIGLLLCEYLFSTLRDTGRMPHNPLAVKTIVSSDLAFPIAKAYGVEMVEVLTGFKYIGEVIGQLEKAGEVERFIFGFEESCGYLGGAHVRDKDGVMASMLVCEMAQSWKQRGWTLWQALQELYRRYGYVASALLSFEISGPVPMEEMARRMAFLRQSPLSLLAGEPVTSSLDYLPGLNGLPSSNVLSYSTAAGLKMIIRPSGTEPKIKAYLFAQGKTQEAAQAALTQLERQARELLS